MWTSILSPVYYFCILPLSTTRIINLLNRWFNQKLIIYSKRTNSIIICIWILVFEHYNCVKEDEVAIMSVTDLPTITFTRSVTLLSIPYLLTVQFDEISVSCVKTSTIPCRADSDCIKYSKNSLCIDNTVESPGHCECFKDFIPQQNKTYFECYSKPQTLNDKCVKDIQCQYQFSNWAVCTNGKCACIEGSHFWDKECYQSIGLGQTCSFNQQCRLKNGSIASCLAGKCSCGFREHPVSALDGDSCEPDRELGEQCSKDEECVTENTRCFGVCDCKPGFTTNGDGRGCLKEAEKLGDYCIEDTQCEIISDNTFCEHYACHCRNHHHIYLGKCYKSVRLNQTCEDDRNCWYISEFKDRIHCKEGRCTCLHQYTQDGRLCVNAGFKFKNNVILFGIISVWKLIY